MIDVQRKLIMTNASYELMRYGVAYNAEYVIGGMCVIKKAAEDIHLGIVTATFPDGTIKRRHYSFFSLMGMVTDE